MATFHVHNGIQYSVNSEGRCDWFNCTHNVYNSFDDPEEVIESVPKLRELAEQPRRFTRKGNDMAKLVVSEYYPVAESGYSRKTYRVKPTGEFRPPREGEWYLSGAIIEGYQAQCDFNVNYHIGILVEGREVTVWQPGTEH